MPSITDTAEAESAVAAASVAEVDAFMDEEMKKDAGVEQLNPPAALETPDKMMNAADVTLTQKAVPPAVAALDAKLAPFMNMKTIPQPQETKESKNQFIAVRVGYATKKLATSNDAPNSESGTRSFVTTVRNAIFLSWDDAREFVEFEKQQDDLAEGEKTVKTVPFYSNVEWKAFDQFEKAEVSWEFS